MKGESGLNPRYVAYATSHGFDAATMLAVDEIFWPGGKMAGFSIWVTERWREWRLMRRVAPDAVLWPADHADFDEWLAADSNDREESE